MTSVKNTPAEPTEWQAEWSEWLRDWRIHLEGTHAAQTVPTYLRGAQQFLTYLAANAPEAVEPGLVTRRHVEGWMSELAKTGKSPATRRVRLMTLRTLFGWMAQEPGSGVDVSPAGGVRAPEVALTPVRVVTDEDLRAVLATCSTASFTDLRDAAMLRVLIACGLRRAELVTLDLPDVDLNRGDLLIHGKGGKPRLVSIGSSKTALGLSRYLRARRKHPLAAGTAAVFLTTRTTPTSQPRLTGGAVAEMLHRRCRTAGVPEFHPHALRHAWADANKRAGLSDEDLERMAGWSSPLMVRRYGRALADGRARDAHDRLKAGDRV